MGCFPDVRFHESMPNSGVGLEDGQWDTQLRSAIFLSTNHPSTVRSFIEAARVKGSVWPTAPVITGK